MMRLVAKAVQVFIIAFPGLAMAGDLEVGAAGGFGFYQDATITNASGSALAGFGPRFALSGMAEWDWSRLFGVEGRYLYQDGDLELRSHGAEANLDGQSHALTAELVFHAPIRKSRWTIFSAAGGGVKIFQATQTITGARPLSDFASLATGSQALPLLSFGAGVKYAFSPRWLLRLEFRDYLTAFPNRLFQAAAGARVRGGTEDIVPTLGISRTF